MPFLILPPFFPHASLSLLEWYIVPLSDFDSSLYFLSLVQTICFCFVSILNLFSCYFPPLIPWYKLSIGAPLLCPKPAAKKTLQWFPSKQDTYVTRFYTFPSHRLKPKQCVPSPIEAQTPCISVLKPSPPPPASSPLSRSQCLNPGPRPSLHHLTSSSSSLARGSSLLFCCSWPACAVREEEWDSM